MGSVLATGIGLFLSVCVSDRFLGLLERRTSSRRKGHRLLFHILDLFLLLQLHYVDCRRSNFPANQGLRKSQGHVGMVLRAEHA